MHVRRLAGDLRFDRGSIRARDLAIETDRTKLVTSISYSGPRETAARHLAQCRAPVAAGDRPIFPPARDYQARACRRRESARDARCAEHGRQRRLVCGHGARAAGRSLRQRAEEPRRAARRARRRHGADSQSTPSGRRGSPGRPTSRGRSARRRSISNSPVRMSRASAIRPRTSARRACMSPDSLHARLSALRRQRRRIRRHRDDARDLPFLDAVAAVVVSPRRYVSKLSTCGGCPIGSRCRSSKPQAAGNYTFEAQGRDWTGTRNARRFDRRGGALRVGHAARH